MSNDRSRGEGELEGDQSRDVESGAEEGQTRREGQTRIEVEPEGKEDQPRREGEQKVATRSGLTAKLMLFLRKMGIPWVLIKVPTNPNQHIVSLAFPNSADDSKTAEQGKKEAKKGGVNFANKYANTFINSLIATEGWKQWSQKKVEQNEIKEIGAAPGLLRPATTMDKEGCELVFLSKDAEEALGQILNNPTIKRD